MLRGMLAHWRSKLVGPTLVNSWANFGPTITYMLVQRWLSWLAHRRYVHRSNVGPPSLSSYVGPLLGQPYFLSVGQRWANGHSDGGPTTSANVGPTLAATTEPTLAHC
ncbi:unnamed protein product [Owenia fusiformis]|uniref:Uncharacterized protein n=1 Tax=Owenia fusiformis TaxID=6347 RepID=A0A8J1XNI4_OWEFU|nr:unnamed protein product [Owenia fusiformis]